MRMPFKQEVPPSRIERIRCGVQSRTADAAHAAQHAARYTADHARPAAADAAAAAQSAAASASDAAATAARTVADAASTAAASVAERARPLASEAASRGSAAWAILRYGAPSRSPFSRVAALVPTTAVGKVGSVMKTKSGSAIGLMAFGGVAAACVMYWRKSRMGTDSVWILDEADSDLESPEGWHEGSSRMSASARAGERESAADRLADRAAGMSDAEHGRKRSDTWP